MGDNTCKVPDMNKSRLRGQDDKPFSIKCGFSALYAKIFLGRRNKIARLCIFYPNTKKILIIFQAGPSLCANQMIMSIFYLRFLEKQNKQKAKNNKCRNCIQDISRRNVAINSVRRKLSKLCIECSTPEIADLPH